MATSLLYTKISAYDSEFDIHNHDSYFISTGNQFYSYVTHKIPHQGYTEPTHNESSGATY